MNEDYLEKSGFFEDIFVLNLDTLVWQEVEISGFGTKINL